MSNYDDQLDCDIKLDDENEEKTERSIIKEKKSEEPQFSTKQPSTTTQSNHVGSKQNLGVSDYDISKASHPMVCIFSIAFKISALFFYLVMGYILPSVITFILVTVLGAIDFWTIKNISGRLLVGLRWWSEVDEKGKQVWKFQSKDHDATNPVDKVFFWSGQIVATLCWGLFFILNILSIHWYWAWLNFILVSLSATNLYGYYQCQGDFNKKLNKLKAQGLMGIASRFL